MEQYSKEQVIEMMNYYGKVRYVQGRNDELLNPSENAEVIKEISRLMCQALNNFDKFVPPEIKEKFPKRERSPEQKGLEARTENYRDLRGYRKFYGL